MNVRRPILLVAALCTASVLAACGGTSGGSPTAKKADVPADAVALVDGKPRTVLVDLTTPVDGDDKICGGVMRVFVERISG